MRKVSSYTLNCSISRASGEDLLLAAHAFEATRFDVATQKAADEDAQALADAHEALTAHDLQLQQQSLLSNLTSTPKQKEKDNWFIISHWSK